MPLQPPAEAEQPLLSASPARRTHHLWTQTATAFPRERRPQDRPPHVPLTPPTLVFTQGSAPRSKECRLSSSPEQGYFATTRVASCLQPALHFLPPTTTTRPSPPPVFSSH